MDFALIHAGPTIFGPLQIFNSLNSLLNLFVNRIDKNNVSLFQQVNLSSWSKNNFVRMDI